MDNRIGKCSRKTNETDISITINLDGKGHVQVDTGIGFFDHMLNAFARHGLFDLDVEVKGDLDIDCHHTVEDTGIVLGRAIADALGEKKEISRYGNFILPMDEALALCAVDLSGRSFLVFNCEFTVESIGDLKTEMIKEFFYGVAGGAGMNLHFRMLDGSNNHHMSEALFKGFGRALSMAVQVNPRLDQVWSTKGSLS